VTYLIKFEPKTYDLFEQDEFISWLSEVIKRDISLIKDAHKNKEGLIEMVVEIQEPIVEVAEMVRIKDKYNNLGSKTNKLHGFFHVG
jgi:hypothetical protein